MAETDEPPAGTAAGLLTQKEYGKRKGWSKQYVNQLVKKGRIPLQGGKIDPTVADAALERERDPARDRAYRMRAPENETPAEAPPQAAAQVPSGPFSKARTLRELYRARREKLEYDRLAGNLVSAAAVKTAVYGATVELRISIQAAWIDLGKTLAGKYGLNEREVVGIASAAIDKALTELSDHYMERCLAYKKRQSLEPED